MSTNKTGYLTKLAWSLPWLASYPVWRARELVSRMTEKSSAPEQIIMLVANHFEPGWSEHGAPLDLATQMSRLEHWCELAQKTGAAVRDGDGAAFRHTLFYPGEEYYAPLLERMAELEHAGFGEVEIHLHHGVDRPDTAANLRRQLLEFRDALAGEHRCLSRVNGEGPPMYAFVHGNLALGNSAGGRFCGVDSELEILAETGCYADFTLPSAPDQSQVPKLNAIYQCGHPLSEARPHATGADVRVGDRLLQLPLIFTGPLLFNWRRRVRGLLPIPRLDDGVLAGNYPLDLERLTRWRTAHIGVRGLPDWNFIKLYCHGFFPQDQEAMIGDAVARSLEKLLELQERTRAFNLYFTTAREAFNIVMAAVEGLKGEPGQYRDYRLRSIMREETSRISDRHHQVQPFAPVAS